MFKVILLVLYPWKPAFDPYLEVVKWVDLWVRILRLPVELMNFDSIANLLSANDIGALIKLDQRSLLRNKIRFARACIRVNIQAPLLEFAEVSREGDLVNGYIVWYEDFSVGCSFSGESMHDIEACPLLTSPKKEVTIQLIKSPKQKSLYNALAKTVGQENHAAIAKQADVVHVQSKHIPKHKPHSLPIKKRPPKVSGLTVKIPAKGVMINDIEQLPDKVYAIGATKSPSHLGKGKGKALFAAANVSDDTSDDEAIVLVPPVSPPGIEPAFERIAEPGEKVPPLVHPVPTRVFVSSALIDANKYIPLTPSDGSPLLIILRMSLVVILHSLSTRWGGGFEDLSPAADNSLFSLHSDNSIMNQIRNLGMNPSLPLILSSQTSSAKRGIEDGEEDDASFALKRKRI